MQYTDNEAALIGGLISNYFFQPSVDATAPRILSPGAVPFCTRTPSPHLI